MDSTPRLQKSNRFACLPIEEVEEPSTVPTHESTTPDVQKPEPATAPIDPTAEPAQPTHRIRLARWEKRLPHQYVVAAAPSALSLDLPVELETTDTQEIVGVTALVDSGATGLFIHPDFVKKHRLTTRPLARPIPVRNVDGTTNTSGGVSEIVDIVLRYQGHTERAIYAVIGIGSQDMILGFPWLKEHNPEIDWATKEVKMSQCPQRCQHCREEVKVERKDRAKNRARTQKCRAGGIPHADLELEEVPETLPNFDFRSATDAHTWGPEPDPEMTPGPDAVEDGDRIFATALHPDPPTAEDIRASQTTSQRLAQAFAANEPTRSFRDAVPAHLHDFEDIFAKSSFDALPDQKLWATPSRPIARYTHLRRTSSRN